MSFSTAAETLSGLSGITDSYSACQTLQTNGAPNMCFALDVTAQGGAGAIHMMVEASSDETVWVRQQAGSVSSGVETLDNHEMSKAISGATTIGISMPTNGWNYMRLSVKADTGTPTLTATGQRG